MKRTARWILLCVSVLALLPLKTGYAAAESIEKPKVIAVVFDNSTSMVRDDPGEIIEQYTTRWVEADYAVRALAAMMNAGDTLKLYPFSVDSPVDIHIGTESEYDRLCQTLDEMNYYGKTPYENIKNASDDLKRETGKDCYLIVISDGNLKSGDGTGPDMTQEEVNAAFSAIASANPSLQMKYIPIGKGDMRLPEHTQVELCRDSDNITQQITDAINGIYHRVAVNGVEKIDIPLKSMTVFLQDNPNAEEFFNNWDAMQHGYDLEDKTVIHSTGKNPADHWMSTETLYSDWIKTTELLGLVLSYTVPSGANEFVAVPSDGSFQIYYEPAVTQRITIQQNDDDPFVYGESSESHFVEGSIHVTIEYLDMAGQPLKSQKAVMLKTDQVEVSVNEYPLTGELNQETGVYTYSGMLEQGDSGYLTITNKIGLNNGRLDIPLGVVGEPYVELSAQSLDSNLTLDRTGSAVLRVQINDSNGGDIFAGDGKWERFLTPVCIGTYFKVDTTKCEYYSDGRLYMPVSLKDPGKHQIEPQETFTFSIERVYSDSRTPATNGKTKIQVDINSLAHELSIEPETDDLQFDIWQIFLHGAEIPLSYFCDGEELTPEQLETAEIQFDVEKTLLSDILTLKDGNIHIGRPSFWRLLGGDMAAQAKISWSYTKWNRLSYGEYQIPITIKAFPRGVVAAVIVIAVIMGLCFMVWLGWFLPFMPFNSARDEYIPFNTEFRFEMAMENDNNEFPVPWGFWRWMAFRASPFRTRCAHIHERIKDYDLDINLYIHRDKNDTWTLIKLNKMRPSANDSHIQIGLDPVSPSNCQFSTRIEVEAKNCLQIKNKEETSKWKLRIIMPERKR